MLFEGSFLKRHGLLLLKPDRAVEFVYECEKQRVVLLGIDVFLLSQDHIQPLMELGIDFTLVSNSYPIITRYNMAREKIRSTENLYYEIVIEV